MENNLELVRDILTSEKFQNAPVAEQEHVLQQIEIDVFEKMPYDVFVSIVRKGNIQGKDLIYLCNVSPKLRHYCNRELILGNGNILSKYLFRQILQDKGINLSATVDPEQVYLAYYVGDGFAFRSLDKKVKQLLEIYHELAIKIHDPYDVYDLLYNNSFLIPIDWRILNRRIIADTLYAIENLFEHYIGYTTDPNITRTLENILKYNKADIRNARDLIRKDILHNPAYPTLSKYSEEDIVNILNNYEEYFRSIFATINEPDYILEDKIWKNFNNKKSHLEGEIDDLERTATITEEKGAELHDKLHNINLTSEDVQYIIKLHKKVLAGKLKISTPYIIGYLI